MQTPLHTRLICCWLAILVLVSSTGFGMIEHWCQMRGHTKTLLIADDSCPKPCQSGESLAPVSGTPSISKLPCCKTSLSYHHLEVSRFVVDQHTQPAPQPTDFIPNLQFQRLLVSLQPTDASEPLLLIDDDPNARSGRFRLTTLCIWLI